eukprot:s641_g5.t1
MSPQKALDWSLIALLLCQKRQSPCRNQGNRPAVTASFQSKNWLKKTPVSTEQLLGMCQVCPKRSDASSLLLRGQRSLDELRPYDTRALDCVAGLKRVADQSR